MRDDEQLSSLIGDIYDAALNPSLWVDVLGKARAFVVGLAASLYWKDATSKRGAVRFTDGGIDPYHCEQYFDKYGKLDPTATGLFFATVEEPMAMADIVPYDELVATRFYREWRSPWVLSIASMSCSKNRSRALLRSSSFATCATAW